MASDRLSLFIDAIRPSFDELREKAGSMASLRDWETVRTKFQENLSVNVLSAKSTQGGRVIDVAVEGLTSDPFDPLGDTSIGWILEDGSGREYTVNAVHKLRGSERDAAGPVIELKGAAELPVSAFGTGAALTGLLNFAEDSATVTGSGTAFLGEVSVGQYVAPADNKGFMSRVLSVDSNVQITLTRTYIGTDVIAVNSVVSTAVDGVATLRPQGQIEVFGKDFDIDVDQGIPEVFQRATVRDVHQWRDRKGAAESFVIIAGMYGYDAVITGLWRIDSASVVPAGTEIFELPAGSGKLYTPLGPFRPLFDEIAADVIPTDLFCWEALDWTTNAITPPVPSPPDGTLTDAAIGSTMQGLIITATTELGGGRWKIEVDPAEMFPVVGVLNWYASFSPMAGTKFFLETVPIETAPGVWEFEVQAGVAPTFGTTVDIDYLCQVDISCGFCRASAIRVEVVPNEAMFEGDMDFTDVDDRIEARMLQAVPAHVRVFSLDVQAGVVVNGNPVVVNGNPVIVGP